MGLKYEFTDEIMNYEGHLFHRIKRLSDDKIGGWIEFENNLSQEDNCWVDDNAKVYGDAKVSGNAQVYSNALVHGNAEVYGNAQIYGKAEIFDETKVYGNAQVYDNAEVYGCTKVYDNGQVCDDAKVYDHAKVYGNAKVYDNAQIYGYADIYDHAQVYGDAWVRNDAQVLGNAQVYGDAEVYGAALVYDDAKICGNAKVYGDAIVFGNAEVYNIKINSGEYHGDKKDLSNEDLLKEAVLDFIYKVNNFNKILIQTEYNSINEFFDTPITNDVKLDTLLICAMDTKEPLIKLQKVKAEDKTEFKFIVDITTNNNDNFSIKSTIETQDQLNQKLEQTIEALKHYPEFNKYVDDLENCL